MSPQQRVHCLALALLLPMIAMAQLPDPVTQFEIVARVYEKGWTTRACWQGSNSKTLVGYFGPRPPPGDPPHPYHFQVFALDVTLNLPSGFNRHALLKAMEGHVLAEGTLVGTFAKQP